MRAAAKNTQIKEIGVSEIRTHPRHPEYKVRRLNLPVFTVSPKSWNLDCCPRKRPAVTGPEFRPKRMFRSCCKRCIVVRKGASDKPVSSCSRIKLTPVSGPNCVSLDAFRIQEHFVRGRIHTRYMFCATSLESTLPRCRVISRISIMQS